MVGINFFEVFVLISQLKILRQIILLAGENN